MAKDPDHQYSSNQGSASAAANDPVPEQPAKQPAPEPSERGADRFQIFEKIALERLQAGSDSTKAASFLPLPVRLTAVAAAGIAGLGLLWSIVARVPVQVNGVAAIVPASGLSTLAAGTTGVLHFQVSGVGPQTLPDAAIRNNELISGYWLQKSLSGRDAVSSMQTLSTITAAALAPESGQTFVLPESLTALEAYDRAGVSRSLRYPDGTVLASIADEIANNELESAFAAAAPTASLQKAQESDRLRRSRQLGQLGRLQGTNRVVVERELAERQALYSRYVELWKKGFVPATTLLEEQNRINGLKSQLLSSSGNELNTNMSQRDQLDQATQAKISNVESRMKLETQLITYLRKTRIFALNSDIYILAAYFSNGALVKAGDEIFSYTIKPPQLPNQVPVFLDAAAAQQVNEGMGVLLTPRGISRAQYGGIRGRVVSVAKLPIAAENLVGTVGSRAMATQIQQTLPAPYLATVELERAEPDFCKQIMSSRCYRWSSGQRPPHPVRLNSLADVQVTTVYRRPIEFVMPALKRILGLVVDNK